MNFRNRMNGTYEYLNHFDDNSRLPHIFVTLSLDNQERRKIDVRALLDTGASNNFLSRDCLKSFGIELNKLIRNCHVTILTGFYNIRKECNGTVDLRVVYISEQNEWNTFVTRFLIIESSIECILGYDIIRQENMMSKFSSLFGLMVPSEVSSLNVHSELTMDPERGHFSESVEIEIPQIEEDESESNDKLVGNASNFTTRFYENEDIEEISDEYLQVIPAEILDVNVPIQNEDYDGPEDLKQDLKNLVWEYRDRFRKSISLGKMDWI